MSLSVLHQDEDFVAIYKPAGLLVHRTFLDAQETQFCVQMLRDQLGRDVFPCHRLDKPTAGILLFALNASALKRAQTAFRLGQVEKKYLAIVRGWIEEEGLIDYPLRYEADDYDTNRGGRIQEAQTQFRRLAQTELPLPAGRYPTSRYSLVELLPRSGRKHQLRRHLAHLRHPIAGDTRHGDGAHNRFFRQHFACHRLLLVATELTLRDEPGPPWLLIKARPDQEFLRVARQTNLAVPASALASSAPDAPED